jgi:hypothetical protein
MSVIWHFRQKTCTASITCAATAIGTGRPFGAEAPIIQMGGALGSLAGHLICGHTARLSSGTRQTSAGGFPQLSAACGHFPRSGPAIAVGPKSATD